jgi:hypothetical protein
MLFFIRKKIKTSKILTMKANWIKLFTVSFPQKWTMDSKIYFIIMIKQTTLKIRYFKKLFLKSIIWTHSHSSRTHQTYLQKLLLITIIWTHSHSSRTHQTMYLFSSLKKIRIEAINFSISDFKRVIMINIITLVMISIKKSSRNQKFAVLSNQHNNTFSCWFLHWLYLLQAEFIFQNKTRFH